MDLSCRLWQSLQKRRHITDNSWLRGTVFECSRLPPNSLFRRGLDYLWNSYGMSARLNDRVDDLGDYRGDFKHPNLIKTPSETTLLIDCTQQWSGTIVTATPAPSNSQLAAVQNAAAASRQSAERSLCRFTRRVQDVRLDPHGALIGSLATVLGGHLNSFDAFRVNAANLNFSNPNS